jgi:hypothetical protein
VAEASGSRTHQRRGAPLTGFEDQAQHRQELASKEIFAINNSVAFDFGEGTAKISRVTGQAHLG